jgi:hypothetical protein
MTDLGTVDKCSAAYGINSKKQIVGTGDPETCRGLSTQIVNNKGRHRQLARDMGGSSPRPLPEFRFRWNLSANESTSSQETPIEGLLMLTSFIVPYFG